MILLLLAVIVSATAYPDYYALWMDVYNRNTTTKFKIFTKIGECTRAVYQSGDNRVLFADGVWKIGTLKNDLDCNTLSSVVEEEYRTRYTTKKRPEDRQWFEMKKNVYTRVSIFFEDLYEHGQKRGLKLVGGTMVDDKSKEDCFEEDWGRKYPDKDIVVAFHDSNCFYDFVDQAQLDYDYSYASSATLLVHPAGKNILYIYK